MADPRPVRIFISSPDDVRPERGIAARVVHRLAREFAHHFTVEAVLWEREPLLASAHFQDGLIAPHDTDIVVVVLWSRLGLPLPADKYTGPLSGRRVTGTEWEFEDALAGYRQRQRPELLVYRKHAEVVARIGDRAAVEEQQRQAELVEDFMRRWFSDADGVSATAAWRAFADGAAFEGMLEQHLRELLRRRLAGSAGKEGAIVRWHQGSPYRGLEAFEPEHEQIFFGRTRARNEVRELLARQVANGTAFVLVMGASGSGKSSLVKAAVVPELREAGMVGHAAMVRHALTRPGAFDAAGGPLSGLAAALFEGAALPELAAASSDNTPDALAALLARTPTATAQPIRHALAAVARTAGVTSRGEARLLLVVDQLEELFTTDGISPEDRTRYVAALAALASSGLVWVVATMRSDFFDRLERLPPLARLAGGEAKYLLTPPDDSEIGQIIRQPAREAGLHFEIDSSTGHSLDETIREAAAGDAASLPLLEYLLDQLWHRRTASGQLTYAAYQELGGLHGAIGRRAEEVLAGLAPEVQAALPRLLRALVSVQPGTRTAATARY
ncbi:MAG: ATP-binding protein, partial [Alphaproteobacteria bacterium]|nr:ATP-binding protein [Alphaproteobacteria bacterium]